MVDKCMAGVVAAAFKRSVSNVFMSTPLPMKPRYKAKVSMLQFNLGIRCPFGRQLHKLKYRASGITLLDQIAKALA